VITGERLVHPTSPVGRPRFAYSYLPSMIERDRAITKAVHQHDTLIFAQLNHVGVEGSSDAVDDLRVLYGPSEISSPLFGETAKAMDRDDIEEIVAAFASCAEYTREGGFDGIELHVAHGYLLSQFLSPLYNHRDDEYGGTLENRLRLTRDVIGAIRARVGRDFVVGVRIGLTEFMPGGYGVEESIEAVAMLGADGEIDFFNTSAGGYHSGQHRLIAPSDTEDGWLVEDVARIKDAAGQLPVFAVGALRDPRAMHDIVASGKADMVGAVRAVIADPELPNKLREGRDAAVYRCIKGNQGCISRVWRGLPMACTVNPVAGREGAFGEDAIAAVDQPKRWLVVGGGPAGLKAAETLARRGHHVTLIEREDSLGGQVRLIVRAPGRDTFMALVEDLSTQLDALGVDVRLGQSATVSDVSTLSPDDVIVATGAHPDRSGYSSAAPHLRELPGAGRDSVLTTWDVLRDPEQAGRHVVVLDDQGTREVAGVAEVLLDAGREVELVSRWNSLFPFTATTLDQPLIARRLLRKGLRCRLSSWALGIERDGVHIRDLLSEEDARLAGIDTVVLATGRRSDTELYSALSAAGIPAIRIDDCLAARTLDHAVYEGFVAGLERVSSDERYLVEGQLETFA
jgi:2,4-dienoyl-CoA reductase-like NADH-dependent reductase (Old Yellow Enzyme family)/pyruvate/2-oxoglutarate dehydrogenase complex dihydrolipoamide dehydrogenase (E3) component